VDSDSEITDTDEAEETLIGKNEDVVSNQIGLQEILGICPINIYAMFCIDH
jgi:hypothetical protein